jgi:hypothetical protein
MRRTLMASVVIGACLTLLSPMSGASSAEVGTQTSPRAAQINSGRAAVAAPRVTSETATSGSLRATVSYVLLPKSSRYYVRLAVERDGRQIYDERVRSVSRPGAWNQPIGVWRTQGLRSARTISLRDLDGDGEPEILLEFWYGGAHCCFWTRIYRWDESRGSYTNIAHIWGNVDYRLADLHRVGRLELVTADDRFAYAFTSFAGSGFPIQIWDYRRGRLVNMTRTYGDAIARDAARQWRWYGEARRRGWEVRGLLAAWAADECLLGHSASALAWLQRHRFVLTAPNEQRPAASPSAYLKNLRVFLRRAGYLR